MPAAVFGTPETAKFGITPVVCLGDGILPRRRAPEETMTKWLVITRFLGEKDAAFAALEKAFVGRARIVDINVDPVFDNLRSDPRFIDLLRRISFPQ